LSLSSASSSKALENPTAMSKPRRRLMVSARTSGHPRLRKSSHSWIWPKKITLWFGSPIRNQTPTHISEGPKRPITKSNHEMVHRNLDFFRDCKDPSNKPEVERVGRHLIISGRFNEDLVKEKKKNSLWMDWQSRYLDPM
jgi:hypothetical protein